MEALPAEDFMPKWQVKYEETEPEPLVEEAPGMNLWNKALTMFGLKSK